MLCTIVWDNLAKKELCGKTLGQQGQKTYRGYSKANLWRNTMKNLFLFSNLTLQILQFSHKFIFSNLSLHSRHAVLLLPPLGFGIFP